VAITLIALDAVLQIVAQARLPNPAGVVELVPAVFYSCMRYAERHDTIPNSRKLWMLSLELALIAMVISLVIAGVMMLVFSGSEAMSDFDVLFEAPVGLLLGGMIFSVGLSVLMTRISLYFAMRSGFKARKR